MNPVCCVQALPATLSRAHPRRTHLLTRFSSLFHVRALSLDPLALLLLPLSPTAPDPASARLRGPAQRCACGPDSPGSPVTLEPSRPRVAPSAAPPLAGGPSPLSCRMRGLSTTLLEAALASLSLACSSELTSASAASQAPHRSSPPHAATSTRARAVRDELFLPPPACRRIQATRRTSDERLEPVSVPLGHAPFVRTSALAVDSSRPLSPAPVSERPRVEGRLGRDRSMAASHSHKAPPSTRLALRRPPSCPRFLPVVRPGRRRQDRVRGVVCGVSRSPLADEAARRDGRRGLCRPRDGLLREPRGALSLPVFSRCFFAPADVQSCVWAPRCKTQTSAAVRLGRKRQSSRTTFAPSDPARSRSTASARPSLGFARFPTQFRISSTSPSPRSRRRPFKRRACGGEAKQAVDASPSSGSRMAGRLSRWCTSPTRTLTESTLCVNALSLDAAWGVETDLSSRRLLTHRRAPTRSAAK